jgi:hypothetical protein
MVIGKRYGPGEGYSTRRGGELGADDGDDVEGHAFGVMTTEASGPQGPGTRSSDMGDTIEPEGAIKTVKATDEDVEGHGTRGMTPKAADEAEADSAWRKRKASDDDDVEGHGVRGVTPKAVEPEGVGTLRKASDDDDDVEGHAAFQKK